MKAEPYKCECGGTTFVKYINDSAIYCKSCGKVAPKNVKFKDGFSIADLNSGDEKRSP